MAKKDKKEKEEKKEKTTKHTLKAVKNHFAPDGKFVENGSEKKVGGAEKDQLLETGNYILL